MNRVWGGGGGRYGPDPRLVCISGNFLLYLSFLDPEIVKNHPSDFWQVVCLSI